MHARFVRNGRPSQRSRLAAIATIAATTAFSLASAPAYPVSGTGSSSRSSSLDFAVSLPRTAELRITCTPGAIEITAADVERGSVDVPLAWCVEIRANIPYELSFAARASWFRSALLRGFPVPVEVRDGSGRYEESRATGPSIPRRLGVTFYLAPRARAGRYAWPLAIALEAN